jgi:hypothetical protein
MEKSFEFRLKGGTTRQRSVAGCRVNAGLKTINPILIRSNFQKIIAK